MLLLNVLKSKPGVAFHTQMHENIYPTTLNAKNLVFSEIYAHINDLTRSSTQYLLQTRARECSDIQDCDLGFLSLSSTAYCNLKVSHTQVVQRLSGAQIQNTNEFLSPPPIHPHPHALHRALRRKCKSAFVSSLSH